MCKTQPTTLSISTTSPLKPTPPSPLQVELTINSPETKNRSTTTIPTSNTVAAHKSFIFAVISRFHTGYFRITLSLCWQTLLWKTLSDPPENAHAYRKMLGAMPSAAFLLIWSLSLFILLTLSILYILKCILQFKLVKDEYRNHINGNYLFAPWISCILLLQTSPLPFTDRKSVCYHFLWWVFVLPIVVLDVKIYGQWFTKGKRFLSTVANPASQLSVIGNFVGAHAAAETGRRESAVILFTLGFVHYLVLFVTLYERLSVNSCMPVMLRPVMFLFIAAPGMASLSWYSISGKFDCSSKMFFYLSVFLFLSLISRPNLFKKSMKKFNVVWWAYSYPLTILALASIEYAHEMKTTIAHLLMLVISGLSVLVSFALMVYTALNINILLPREDKDDDLGSSW